jgi:hypothetical protein
VVNEAFAEEKPLLKSLPLVPFNAVLKLERRVSHEGMVSVGGNLYSVPDTAGRSAATARKAGSRMSASTTRAPRDQYARRGAADSAARAGDQYRLAGVQRGIGAVALRQRLCGARVAKWPIFPIANGGPGE